MTTSHRVYACILRKSNGAADALDVLLSAERYQGTPLIKLPGGGKLPGESDEQCLVRELSEGGAAKEAGIKENDVILKVDNVEVNAWSPSP